MPDIKDTKAENKFWSTRYEEERTGWDIGFPSRPIKEYIDQISDKSIKILIPGAGNAYEAEYLYQNGFKHVDVLDISKIPLIAFQNRNPQFPSDQLILGNFFDHQKKYDLIFEQTFFCSFPPTPENRVTYGQKMSDLLETAGKLVGVWFDIPLKGDMVKRPFGGTREEYVSYLSPYFVIKTFARCHNSIEPRMGTELFGIFVKK